MSARHARSWGSLGYSIESIAERQYKWDKGILAGMLLSILTFTNACSPPSTKVSNSSTQAPPPAVVIQEIKQETVHIPAEFVARTEAVQSVEVRARVEGELVTASFEEGKVVEKDQILFQIDPAAYKSKLQTAQAQLTKAIADLDFAREKVNQKRAEAQLKQAQAALTKAEQDVARLEPLVKEEAVPAQELDAATAQQKVAQADVDAQLANVENTELNQRISIQQAQAAVESAKATVEMAELDLSYTTLRAPISGVIGRKAVSVGNLVGRGEPTLLATISTSNPMKAVFSISELEYLRLSRERAASGTQDKRPVELILADNTVFSEKGIVTVIERALDPTTATILIESEFPNPTGLLRAGQFARVRVEIDVRENAVLVPQRAILEMQGSKTVLVVDSENTVAVRSVRLGERYQSYYVVAEGLSAGERVIVEGVQKVRPGMKVTPTAEAMTQEPV